MAKKINDGTETLESQVITENVSHEAPKMMASSNKNQETLVYCGPTIKGVVQQYAHFTKGIPKNLKEYIATHKSVKKLIVPLDKLIETKRNIHTAGTVENLTYNKIEKGE